MSKRAGNLGPAKGPVEYDDGERKENGSEYQQDPERARYPNHGNTIQK